MGKEDKMTGKLKVLGLALVAVWAMSAVAASGAQAQVGKLTINHIENEETVTDSSATLTGNQVGVHVFTANGHEVTCEHANFHAEIEDGAETVTTSAPEYTGCHIILGFTFSATVTVPAGCDYHFSNFETEGAAGEYTGDTKLTCTGEPIKINVPAAGCSITIGGTQSFANSVSASNMSETIDDITLNATVSGISFTSSGGLCGSSGNTGTYNGLTTIKAEKTGGGEQTELTISHS
jgi:hypothetical protein